MFHDDALAHKISCPDNASAHLLNTALDQLAPKKFQQLSQNNSGGTYAQSDGTEEIEKTYRARANDLKTEWSSKLVEQERSEDGHCWLAIHMKELTATLPDRVFSSATSTCKSETLNLCVQLAKQDDSKQKTEWVRIGDGECHLLFRCSIFDMKTVVKVYNRGQHPGLE